VGWRNDPRCVDERVAALRVRRRRLHLPQKFVAIDLGYSRTHIVEIETGSRNPSEELVSRYRDWVEDEEAKAASVAGAEVS